VRTDRTGLFMAVRDAQLPSSNYTSPPSLFVPFPQFNLRVHCTAVQHWVEQTENVSNIFKIPKTKKKSNRDVYLTKNIMHIKIKI